MASITARRTSRMVAVAGTQTVVLVPSNAWVSDNVTSPEAWIKPWLARKSGVIQDHWGSWRKVSSCFVVNGWPACGRPRFAAVLPSNEATPFSSHMKPVGVSSAAAASADWPACTRSSFMDSSVNSMESASGLPGADESSKPTSSGCVRCVGSPAARSSFKERMLLPSFTETSCVMPRSRSRQIEMEMSLSSNTGAVSSSGGAWPGGGCSRALPMQKKSVRPLSLSESEIALQPPLLPPMSRLTIFTSATSPIVSSLRAIRSCLMVMVSRTVTVRKC
mmetsp:Transcript_124493/g.387635  ORF Transcript_124493/g.387635 Transcript_124493/m.387635 type:complete len:277 (+) Transcript_124493:1336-2166(+)